MTDNNIVKRSGSPAYRQRKEPFVQPQHINQLRRELLQSPAHR